MRQTVNEAVDAKEKFLKEIKSAASEHTNGKKSEAALLLMWRKLEWSGEKIKPATAFPEAKASSRARS